MIFADKCPNFMSGAFSGNCNFVKFFLDSSSRNSGTDRNFARELWIDSDTLNTLNTPQQPSTLELGRKQNRIFVSKFQWTGNTKIIWMKAAVQQTMGYRWHLTNENQNEHWSGFQHISALTNNRIWGGVTMLWRDVGPQRDTRDTDGGAGPGGQRARVTQMSRCHAATWHWHGAGGHNTAPIVPRDGCGLLRQIHFRYQDTQL